jgi:primosomal protein N' (replication factor Y)
VQVRGPAPCPLSRLKDRYRWHLLLKAPSREAVRAVLDEAWPQVQKRIGGVVVDVEPVDLL